jgi:hypothetical protein
VSLTLGEIQVEHDPGWCGHLEAHTLPEDTILLLCARRHFLAEHKAAVLELVAQGPVQWEAIYQAAVAHGIAPLVYVNLARCPLSALPIPSQVLARFRTLLGQTLVTKQQMAEKLAQTLHFFSSRSIEVLLIKGAALDVLVYAPHTLTTSQDADIVLRVRQNELTPPELNAIASARAGYSIEYDFYEHHDITINGAVPVDFDRIWRDAVSITYRGQPAWVMCPEDLLIAGCINACRKRYYQLKALCDIAEILQTYPQLDWDAVIQRAHQEKCSNIVFAGLLITRQLLGSPVPDGIMERLAVNPIRAALIRVLLRHRPSQSWVHPPRGLQIFNRRVNASLLLPYATYRWDQIWRKLGFIWHSSQPPANI